MGRSGSRHGQSTSYMLLSTNTKSEVHPFQLAYQALDKHEDRPKWAIVFGGDEYVIFHLAYVVDDSGTWRVALSCSPVLSIYHNDQSLDPNERLPIISAIIFMLLTRQEPQAADTLMLKLGIDPPCVPQELPSGRENTRMASTRIKKV